MGATLVAQAIAHWSHVSDRAFRVLIAMAVTAKDNASKDVPAGLYFGGQDQLTTVLAQTKGGTKDSAIRTVKRAIEELTKAGAIVCTQPAVLGSNAVYKLTLNAIPMPVDNPKPKSTYVHNGRDTTSPPSGDTTSPNGGTTDVPPSKEPLEEPTKELEEEEGVEVVTDAAVDGPPRADEKPESNSSACRDPTCVMGYIHDPTRPPKQRNVPCPQCHPSNVIPFGRRSA